MTFSTSTTQKFAVTVLASLLPLLAVTPQQASAQQRVPQRTRQQQIQAPSQPTTPTGPAVLQANPDSSEYTCQGYNDCNNAISDCIAADGDFEATEYDDEGGVVGGTCSH
ncbi:hypothetical protein [Leptothoe kymatousa]|uniref:Excalibur calcium-binding domain-containing protein n=1 Tax=Leptothoe kymatousa TAU-MAC 1615 TaxID=2364775 RepID=A0ABS5Y632_9CYAN|nr:hypothetical protein [Leptothoe kymatousa]MBT9313271.1 hypothetical protein [Leptothoe kymatousa TAU-MAC 1615]